MLGIRYASRICRHVCQLGRSIPPNPLIHLFWSLEVRRETPEGRPAESGRTEHAQRLVLGAAVDAGGLIARAQDAELAGRSDDRTTRCGAGVERARQAADTIAARKGARVGGAARADYGTGIVLFVERGVETADA